MRNVRSLLSMSRSLWRYHCIFLTECENIGQSPYSGFVGTSGSYQRPRLNAPLSPAASELPVL